MDVGEGGTRVEGVVEGAVKGAGERGGFGGGDVSECLGKLLEREGKRVGGGGGGVELIRDVKVFFFFFLVLLVFIFVFLMIPFFLGNEMLCLFRLRRRNAKESP